MAALQAEIRLHGDIILALNDLPNVDADQDAYLAKAGLLMRDLAKCVESVKPLVVAMEHCLQAQCPADDILNRCVEYQQHYYKALYTMSMTALLVVGSKPGEGSSAADVISSLQETDGMANFELAQGHVYMETMRKLTGVPLPQTDKALLRANCDVFATTIITGFEDLWLQEGADTPEMPPPSPFRRPPISSPLKCRFQEATAPPPAEQATEHTGPADVKEESASTVVAPSDTDTEVTGPAVVNNAVVQSHADPVEADEADEGEGKGKAKAKANKKRKAEPPNEHDHDTSAGSANADANAIDATAVAGGAANTGRRKKPRSCVGDADANADGADKVPDPAPKGRKAAAKPSGASANADGADGAPNPKSKGRRAAAKPSDASAHVDSADGVPDPKAKGPKAAAVKPTPKKRKDGQNAQDGGDHKKHITKHEKPKPTKPLSPKPSGTLTKWFRGSSGGSTAALMSASSSSPGTRRLTVAGALIPGQEAESKEPAGVKEVLEAGSRATDEVGDDSANVHKYSQAELDNTRALFLGPDRIERLDSAKRRLAAAAGLTPIAVPPSIQMPSLEEVEACAEAVDPYKQDASEVLGPNQEVEAVSAGHTQDTDAVDVN